MKIYDCTIFFDEKMMFDLRLNILNDYVDKFVVAESLYTHSGNRKKQNLETHTIKFSKVRWVKRRLENNETCSAKKLKFGKNRKFSQNLAFFPKMDFAAHER